MLHILHPAPPSPRMRFAAKLLFSELLAMEWTFVTETTGGQPFIQYGGEPKAGALLHIPDSGFLQKTTLEPEAMPQDDLLAAAFWWASGYAFQAMPRYDQHGRYDFASYPQIAEGLHRQPQVHVISNFLGKTLKPHFPINKRPFSTEYTFDIDNPWLFKHKPLHVSLGSLGKKLMGGEMSLLAEQLAVLLGKRDPNDVFDELFRRFPPESTRLFFLIERRHPNDTRHSWRSPAMRRLIKRAQSEGFGIGIHPSYTTFLQPEVLKEEVERLSEIIGEPIVHSRMHFLRYRQPETFRALIAAGIKHDYTTGLYQDVGFPYGMTQPFPWFDLEKNEETELMLHPTSLMDRTLLSYLKLTPEAAMQLSEDVKNTIQQFGGTFIPLYHNELLSDFGEWKGWPGLANCEIYIGLSLFSSQSPQEFRPRLWFPIYR
ncbi:MAG: polysaccharide deacetylase family protein [Bacteroidia bacterium]